MSSNEERGCRAAGPLSRVEEPAPRGRTWSDAQRGSSRTTRALRRPDARSTDLAAVLADPARAADVPLHAIPELLHQLGTVQQTLVARLHGHLVVRPPPSANASDRMLHADEVAARTGLSRDYIYRHAKTFPFTHRIGRRALRFSEQGLHRWLNTRARG